MVTIKLIVNHFIIESGVFSFGAGNDSQLGHGDNQVLMLRKLMGELCIVAIIN